MECSAPETNEVNDSSSSVSALEVTEDCWLVAVLWEWSSTEITPPWQGGSIEKPLETSSGSERHDLGSTIAAALFLPSVQRFLNEPLQCPLFLIREENYLDNDPLRELKN